MGLSTDTAKSIPLARSPKCLDTASGTDDADNSIKKVQSIPFISKDQTGSGALQLSDELAIQEFLSLTTSVV
jgi:hypothetical protein